MKPKNSIMTETYLLSSIGNYHPKLDNNNLNTILIKYISLIIDYMKLITEKINIIKNNYYKYIFIRGLDTITTVFKILLYVTKNIELTYYHSQKAFYFYVEFIEQITDEQNVFLQLSSREACMFVYKKTIFEINNDVRKNMLECNYEENNFKSIIDAYIHIYKNIISYCINHSTFTCNNKLEYVNMCCNKLHTYSHLLNATSVYFEKHNIESSNLFITRLNEKDISIKIYFDILELFIKKMSDKKFLSDNLLIKKINLKIINADFIDKLDNSKLFINWIFE